jgi:hypothetical protein
VTTKTATVPILACYGAAGRDPLVHGSDAGLFDVTRPAKDHLAFGHGARITASVRRWPGWGPRSRCPRSSTATPT